jgi:hypothetical protein
MTAPRIVRTGAVISDGRDVEIGGGDSLHLVLLATADETEDARALDGQRVRITIEPEEAQHGSPLDYLAEMKSLMQGALDGYAISEQTERALRRCMNLANTVSLAIAAERRRQP